MKELTELAEDIVLYLHQCCDETGHGSFQIASRKSGALVQVVLEATPSQRYEGIGSELISLVTDDADSIKERKTVWSLTVVCERIIRRLVEIWQDAAGNGSVEVSCRRQRNGKTRIKIRHSFEDEVVLRPEELDVSIAVELSPTK